MEELALVLPFHAMPKGKPSAYGQLLFLPSTVCRGEGKLRLSEIASTPVHGLGKLKAAGAVSAAIS